MLFMNIFTANLSSSKITHVHMFVIPDRCLDQIRAVSARARSMKMIQH
jgi:diadenosine tetraphosphate (Ap4A) HIT family hydrolase